MLFQKIIRAGEQILISFTEMAKNLIFFYSERYKLH